MTIAAAVVAVVVKRKKNIHFGSEKKKKKRVRAAKRNAVVQLVWVSYGPGAPQHEMAALGPEFLMLAGAGVAYVGEVAMVGGEAYLSSTQSPQTKNEMNASQQVCSPQMLDRLALVMAVMVSTPVYGRYPDLAVRGPV